MFMDRNGRKSNWFCLNQSALKSLGTLLVIVGGVLIIVFVPIRYWLALLGIVLFLAGIILRMNA